MTKILKKLWNGKKVFISGHSGFKGVWISMMLKNLGAEVYGYSLKPNKGQKHFYKIAKENNIYKKTCYGDIRNEKKLISFLNKIKPDLLLHMAAQPLVIDGYKSPQYTFETNLSGTINILEWARKSRVHLPVLIITSDKCYKEKNYPVTENDEIYGVDPYSASKACQDIIANSYIESYFRKYKYSNVCTARSGNVFAGGDFAEDRLVPDIMRSIFLKEKLKIRNKNYIRPWQHVFEPLYGYLLILQFLMKKKGIKNAYNFGPNINKKYKVIDVVDILKKQICEDKLNIELSGKKQKYKETQILLLDSKLAKKELKWNNVLDLKESLIFTYDWYKSYYGKRDDIYIVSQKQIASYFKLQSRKKI